MNTNTDNKISALKIKYQKSFADKCNTLEALSSAYQSESSEKNHDELHKFVHNLAGSAGLYGYDDISQTARVAIDALRQHKSISAVQEPVNKVLDLLRSQQPA